MTTHHTIPPAARWLGYGGLLPFFGLALAFVSERVLFPGFALQAFLVYAATILAFVGGVRWGAALAHERHLWLQLAMSVVPALWAAAALLLPGPRESVAALAAGFAVFAAVDRFWPYPAAPEWMRRLRVHLSLGAIAAHALLWWGL